MGGPQTIPFIDSINLLKVSMISLFVPGAHLLGCLTILMCLVPRPRAEGNGKFVKIQLEPLAG